MRAGNEFLEHQWFKAVKRMENLDFTEDEIREQLTVLGYKNIPKHRLLEFKRDLDELIRCGDWRSLSPSQQVNAKSQEAPAQPSPPAYTKEKVGSMEGFFLHACQDQQGLLNGLNTGDRWQQGARDSYAQHTVGPKLRLPQGAPNRLQVEPGPGEAPDSPLSDSHASSSDSQGRRFIKRKVLSIKDSGTSATSPFTVKTQPSHRSHSPHSSAAVPNAAMSKMYNGQEADDSSDDRSSLYSSFWSDEEKRAEEEEEEEEVEIEGRADVEPVRDVEHSNQETAEVKRPELNDRGGFSGESQPEASSRSEEEEDGDESEEEEEEDAEEEEEEDAEEDDEEDEEELEDADQDEEELDGQDEDGLMVTVEHGDEDGNEDGDEEDEEELEDADHDEEALDGQQEEFEGEDEDGLMVKVENGGEDGNEDGDEDEEDEEGDEEELEDADQDEEELYGQEEEVEGEDEDGLMGKVENGDEDGNEDEDDEKCGSSSDSPTPSLMTSGYGTYRPEEQEGGDYRDDHTLTEFDQDSRGDLSEVRDLEDDGRSLRSFGELDAEPTQEPDYSEGSGCAAEDEFPDAAHRGNPDLQEGIDWPGSRVEQEEQSCRERAEDPCATAEDVTNATREEPEPEAGDQPPLDEGHEDIEAELEGERQESTEKDVAAAVDSEDPDESSSNEDIKFIDSNADLGWLPYDRLCLEWEGNLRHTKDAASCLEGRLADLHISPSAQQDPEKENEGENEQSVTRSSDTESLSAFESYVRGLTRTQSDSDLRPKPKSFIRPAISQQTIKKTDPVAKYFQYKQLWDMFKCPGEVDRRALRWEIREKLAYQPPPPKPRRVYVPNTYIVPTEKKRSALRWEVRNDMANGLHPYKSSCRF